MRHLAAIALTAASTLFVATAAQAGGKYRGHDEGYRGDSDYAQVISSRPIYTQVRVSEPREECWDERVTYRDSYRGGREASQFDTTAGAVIGGVIGGAAGHQFSEGSGKKIATAIGALIGASVGSNAVRNDSRRRDGGYDSYSERTVYEPRCRTVSEARYEDRIDGYDVSYRYAGRTYTTRMPYDPGSRIPVQVQVAPVRY
ncbi:MAG: glycine zipper 2TM domain-containing protein [Stagnimonas sp.]|nr:glycine zipper 2TM domain-containing protein [Stagnimonas sp.]